MAGGVADVFGPKYALTMGAFVVFIAGILTALFTKDDHDDEVVTLKSFAAALCDRNGTAGYEELDLSFEQPSGSNRHPAL